MDNNERQNEGTKHFYHLSKRLYFFKQIKQFNVKISCGTLLKKLPQNNFNCEINRNRTKRKFVCYLFNLLSSVIENIAKKICAMIEKYVEIFLLLFKGNAMAKITAFYQRLLFSDRRAFSSAMCTKGINITLH